MVVQKLDPLQLLHEILALILIPLLVHIIEHEHILPSKDIDTILKTFLDPLCPEQRVPSTGQCVVFIKDDLFHAHLSHFLEV